MTLYEILASIEEATANLIDPETGEINEEAMERLDSLEIDRREKIDNIGCLVKDLKSEASAIKDEAKNLIDRAEVKLNKAERLEKWLSEVLDGETFETARCRIGWRPSERVEILDPDLVPVEFKEYKTTEKIVKKALKDAMKEGNTVPGAVLNRYNNIQIK